jgi:hypothetical protein
MSDIEMLNELSRLKAENAALKAARVPGKVTVKISADGRKVSVYGLTAKFPTTLYREQWERLLNPTVIEQIKALLPSLPLKSEQH